MGLVIPNPQGALAVLLDASGHGLEAYAVAQKARQTVLANAHLSPSDLLWALDDCLQHSIGAAAAVARWQHDQLEFCAIGNVNARLILASHPQTLKVKVGVLGLRMRTPDPQRLSFPTGACLVMHTDGVSLPDSVPRGHAKVLAQSLVEQYGSQHDDASVLVLQRPRRAL
jgi:serine phosphatase RsbU (regulator of sigma subunit)